MTYPTLFTADESIESHVSQCLSLSYEIPVSVVAAALKAGLDPKLAMSKNREEADAHVSYVVASLQARGIVGLPNGGHARVFTSPSSPGSVPVRETGAPSDALARTERLLGFEPGSLVEHRDQLFGAETEHDEAITIDEALRSAGRQLGMSEGEIERYAGRRR